MGRDITQEFYRDNFDKNKVKEGDYLYEKNSGLKWVIDTIFENKNKNFDMDTRTHLLRKQ